MLFGESAAGCISAGFSQRDSVSGIQSAGFSQQAHLADSLSRLT